MDARRLGPRPARRPRPRRRAPRRSSRAGSRSGRSGPGPAASARRSGGGSPSCTEQDRVLVREPDHRQAGRRRRRAASRPPPPCARRRARPGRGCVEITRAWTKQRLPERRRLLVQRVVGVHQHVGARLDLRPQPLADLERIGARCRRRSRADAERVADRLGALGRSRAIAAAPVAGRAQVLRRAHVRLQAAQLEAGRGVDRVGQPLRLGSTPCRRRSGGRSRPRSARRASCPPPPSRRRAAATCSRVVDADRQPSRCRRSPPAARALSAPAISFDSSTSPIPAPTKISASPSDCAQSPTAPAATCRRPISGHLCALPCGRIATPVGSTSPCSRAMFASNASRSSSSAGVSTSATRVAGRGRRHALTGPQPLAKAIASIAMRLPISAVAGVGSSVGAISTTSTPIRPAAATPRVSSIASRLVRPPGVGQQVPTACAASSESMSNDR